MWTCWEPYGLSELHSHPLEKRENNAYPRRIVVGKSSERYEMLKNITTLNNIRQLFLLWLLNGYGNDDDDRGYHLLKPNFGPHASLRVLHSLVYLKLKQLYGVGTDINLHFPE